MNGDWRRFRLFWAGETTSKFGSAMTIVVLPLIAVQTLRAGPFMVGMLEAAAWLPWLAIGLVAGAWVDRLSRWRVMIVSDVVSALLFASVPVASWLGVLTIWHLLVTAVLAGAAAVLYSTAYGAYLPLLVAPEELGRANSRLQGSEKAAQVAGPSVGGLVAQVAGAVAALFIDAVTFVVSAVCLWTLRVDEPHLRQADGPRQPGGLRREIAEGLRFVWSDRILRTLTTYAAASNLAAGALQAVLVVFLVREAGLGTATIGVVLGLIGVGGILGALAAPGLARRLGSARAIVLCEVVSMPFALLIPLTGTGWGVAYLVLGGAVVSAGVVAPNVLSATFLQTACPQDMLGRVSASMRVVNFGTLPVGALAGGALGGLAGLRPAVWMITAGLVACTLILLFGPLRRARDLPARLSPVSVAGRS
ncbi:MFS transporter [Streptosporangiaceae bacterium NEAU-GS5]|nr:MFS transporter [Streptosporangiaceae bacterium NEAU-GS5]